MYPPYSVMMMNKHLSVSRRTISCKARSYAKCYFEDCQLSGVYKTNISNGPTYQAR